MARVGPQGRFKAFAPWRPEEATLGRPRLGHVLNPGSLVAWNEKWVKIQPGNRRFWSMFPFTSILFWVPFLDRPNEHQQKPGHLESSVQNPWPQNQVKRFVN